MDLDRGDAPLHSRGNPPILSIRASPKLSVLAPFLFRVFQHRSCVCFTLRSHHGLPRSSLCTRYKVK